MEIDAFHREHIPEAAALFVRDYTRLRRAVPVLPEVMQARGHMEKMLADCFDAASGVIVLEQGRVAGYLCWFLVDRFRETVRRAAYVPEWGYSCVEEHKERITRALYRAAAEAWSAAACQVHAITLLADDHRAEKAWFWNGFGLAVVDAVRPLMPLPELPESGLLIRRATPADAQALTALDEEHWVHYSRSPVFMARRHGMSSADNREFLSRPKNSVWLACQDEELIGFMRYEGYDFDSAAILESEDGITITGAYVRPEYRGQKVAAALLNAALQDYRMRGLKYCAVNFESYNPEAAVFWMKYFQPVCYSLMRVPEVSGDEPGRV